MLRDAIPSLRPALVLTVLFFLLTGLVYPLVVTLAAQGLFPAEANGSLVRRDGHVVGSALIGQSFARPEYVHPRPSAAGKGYDPLASGGSNDGPTSAALVDRIKGDMATLTRTDGPHPPADLLTASASGLDPDISPEAALYQAPRVAAARHLPLASVRALIGRATETPLLGVLGEPRVDVLALDLALDRLSARVHPPQNPAQTPAKPLDKTAVTTPHKGP